MLLMVKTALLDNRCGFVQAVLKLAVMNHLGFEACGFVHVVLKLAVLCKRFCVHGFKWIPFNIWVFLKLC